MKLIPTTLLTALLAVTSAAQAGVVIGSTRLIYEGSQKESSLRVSNPDKTSYLIEASTESTVNGAQKTPFTISPMQYRLDAGQQNVQHVALSGGNLPADKESLYWVNIKATPVVEQKEKKNTLQLGIKTHIKLIYRPQALKGTPEEVTEKLQWQRNGNNLQVTNPTPFYMNFMSISVDGKEVKPATYVAPGATESFVLPANVNGGNVTWKLISDEGSVGKEHTGTL